MLAGCGFDSKGDAEYFGYNIGQTFDAFANVDSGIAVNDATVGPTKEPRWGAYSGMHQYEVMWMGNGATIAVRFHSSDDSNNDGALTLQILALQ